MSVVIEKLKWRSRRSLLELDLFFDSYIKSGKLDMLSREYLNAYNDLLKLEDSELLLLFQDKATLDDEELQYLIDEIRECKVK